MTADQYRREGAEAMKKAAAEAAYQWWDDDDAQELREHVRAIDVDEVLSEFPTASDAVARLVEAALQVSLAYQGANPMRTADVHRPGCGCLRCAVDQLDCAALAACKGVRDAS